MNPPLSQSQDVDAWLATIPPYSLSGAINTGGRVRLDKVLVVIFIVPRVYGVYAVFLLSRVPFMYCFGKGKRGAIAGPRAFVSLLWIGGKEEVRVLLWTGVFPALGIHTLHSHVTPASSLCK